jgi:peptidoglycan/LPS O-acetylase OafA/YrhL
MRIQLDRRERAVLLASVFIGLAYLASLVARYPIPRTVRSGAEISAGLALVAAIGDWRPHRRPSRPILDDRPLSSYNVGGAGAGPVKGGRLVNHVRRTYMGLGAAMVLLFLVSAVGQNSTSHDAQYWVGAIAWAGFGLVLIAILVVTVMVVVRSFRNRTTA